MLPLHLRILPVYSEYHPNKNINGQRLLRHQVETLAAFNDPNVDVIINTAMTGDGKSLAGYLPVFEQAQPIIAMYPTNELIRDQYAALEQYRATLGLRPIKYEMMFSERITQLMIAHDEKTRLEEVKKMIKRNEILLTNPDLVHLIMSHQYGWDSMRKELPTLTGAHFDYFLFDEYHTFGVPQGISVVNMLGYLHANYRDKPSERRKYLFLSATPTPVLQRLLTRSGLRYCQIEGHYSSSAQGDDYRRILQGCEISLAATNQTHSTEQWIDEHLPQLLAFFQQHPRSKAAILVYSPATARRLVVYLRAYFAPHGITVGENTGITSREERDEALHKDILVGTSTVDIGIDFHINYLIFEAFNAGSFLQRFGRLGRHAGFSSYQAYALVPDFILERLQQALQGYDEIERTTFNAAVRGAYPEEQDFEHYTHRWGVVQAAHVLEALKSQQGRDANQEFYVALMQQYEQIYGTLDKPVMTKACRKYWRLSKNSPEVLKDLLSFRGQSPLDCGVWDLTATQTRDGSSLLTYDLFFLLANTEFEVIEEEDFMREVRRRRLDEREFRKKLLYLKVHTYVPERLNLILGQNITLSERPDALHQLVVWSNFAVREPQHIWRDRVNKRLKSLSLSCIVSDLQPAELKRKYRLGGVFPVYRLQDAIGSDYSIVFGQEALLLESLLFFRPTGGNAPIMA